MFFSRTLNERTIVGEQMDVGRWIFGLFFMANKFLKIFSFGQNLFGLRMASHQAIIKPISERVNAAKVALFALNRFENCFDKICYWVLLSDVWFFFVVNLCLPGFCDKVIAWPKWLQCFWFQIKIGLIVGIILNSSNFEWSFIKHFSSCADPLRSLICMD